MLGDISQRRLFTCHANHYSQAAARTVAISSLYTAPHFGGKRMEIQKLIAGGESEQVEFKSTLQYDVRQRKQEKKLRHEVLKTIVAFLKTRGGPWSSVSKGRRAIPRPGGRTSNWLAPNFRGDQVSQAIRAPRLGFQGRPHAGAEKCLP